MVARRKGEAETPAKVGVCAFCARPPIGSGCLELTFAIGEAELHRGIDQISGHDKTDCGMSPSVSSIRAIGGDVDDCSRDPELRKARQDRCSETVGDRRYANQGDPVLDLGYWGKVVLFYLDVAGFLQQNVRLDRPLARYFRESFSITGSGTQSERYLRRRLEVVGTERLIHSTDYPFTYQFGDPYIETSQGRGRSFLVD